MLDVSLNERTGWEGSVPLPVSRLAAYPKAWAVRLRVILGGDSESRTIFSLKSTPCRQRCHHTWAASDMLASEKQASKLIDQLTNAAKEKTMTLAFSLIANPASGDANFQKNPIPETNTLILPGPRNLSIANASNCFEGPATMVSRAQKDVDNLLDRMRRRMYPESLPALTLYWLKTLYHGGYTSQDWSALDRLLNRELAHPQFAQPEFGPVLAKLQTSIRDLLRDRPGQVRAAVQALPAPRPKLNSDVLVPYMVRLLNEWAPVEVARMLVREPQESAVEEQGLPADTFGRALERLLVREQLSGATLEALLQPALF